MREFELARAKAGAPVCTAKGEDARILCFDLGRFDGTTSIVVAIKDTETKSERISLYDNNGKNIDTPNADETDRLIMAPVKRSGWIVFHEKSFDGFHSFKSLNDVEALPYIFTSKEEAEKWLRGSLIKHKKIVFVELDD